MATAPPDDDAETLDLSDEERQRLRETLLREMEDEEGMSLRSFGAPDVRKGHA
jgi:hypothetical protein